MTNFSPENVTKFQEKGNHWSEFLETSFKMSQSSSLARIANQHAEPNSTGNTSIWQEILSLDAKYNLNRNHNNSQLSNLRFTVLFKVNISILSRFLRNSLYEATNSIITRQCRKILKRKQTNSTHISKFAQSDFRTKVWYAWPNVSELYFKYIFR